MSNLGEALIQVRDDIRDGAEPQVAVREAAVEFGLNPALIERKWHEQYGCTPAEWKDKEAERAASVVDLQRSTLRIAREKAEAEAAKWTIPADRQHLTGKLFRLGRRDYAFVVYANDNPAWAIRAIKVMDGKLVNFPSSRWAEIEPQLRTVIRVRRRVDAQPVASGEP